MLWRMDARTTLRRRLTAAGIGAALLVGLTGCDLFAPQETLHNGATITGVSTDVGQVAVRNVVLVVSGHTTGPAAVVTTLINESSKTTQLKILHKGASQTISLEPQAILIIGGGGAGGETSTSGSSGGSTSAPGSASTSSKDIIIRQLSSTPGGLEAMTFASGSDAVTIQVPVLDERLPWLNTIAP
jgi:hypothetical protein